MPNIPIDSIIPNPEQPRSLFDQKALEELAQSIRENGIIQPVIVEEAGELFILHDGERRWRAAKLAGLTEIPAICVPPMNGDGAIQRLMRALVANIQRENLSCIEEARAYQRLLEQGMTINEISEKTGKAGNVIYNRLAWLELDEEIQELVHTRKISSEERARKALARIPDRSLRVGLARRAAERNLSAKTIEVAASVILHERAEKLGEDAPSIEMASRKYGRPVSLRKWDALAQTGAIPPWSAVETAARKTCQNCILSPQASPAICGECPAPQLLLLLMETVEKARTR